MRHNPIVVFILCLSLLLIGCGDGAFKTSQSATESASSFEPAPTTSENQEEASTNPPGTQMPSTPEEPITTPPNPATPEAPEDSGTTPPGDPVTPPTTEVRYVTLTPNILPFSAPELVNPLRGLYKWRGNEIVDIGENPADTYERYTWKDIETSRDVYDFSRMDRDFNAAIAEGSRFAFRIRSMVGYGTREVAVPSYMESCGWWTNNTFVPDWNAECYLERVERLMNAIGAHFGQDPRISFIDIGMYGQYGEWNMSSSDVNYSQAPNGILPMSLASGRRIIDAHVRAFPSTQLLMKLLSREGHEWTQYAYGLPTTKPIGSRIDCVGRVGFFTQWTNRPEIWDPLKERWRVAPMIGEYCSGTIALDTPNSRDDALGHVEDFHFSAVGNGNMSYWSSLSAADRDMFYQIGKRAGYRMELRQIEYPASIARGIASVRVNATWYNSGVAPVYEGWRVYLYLRDSRSGAIAAKVQLGVDLRQVPITTLRNISETLQLPATLAIGTYRLELAVESTDGFRKNMKLAIENTTPDKSRALLGEITVR